MSRLNMGSCQILQLLLYQDGCYELSKFERLYWKTLYIRNYELFYTFAAIYPVKVKNPSNIIVFRKLWLQHVYVIYIAPKLPNCFLIKNISSDACTLYMFCISQHRPQIHLFVSAGDSPKPRDAVGLGRHIPGTPHPDHRGSVRHVHADGVRLQGHRTLECLWWRSAVQARQTVRLNYLELINSCNYRWKGVDLRNSIYPEKRAETVAVNKLYFKYALYLKRNIFVRVVVSMFSATMCRGSCANSHPQSNPRTFQLHSGVRIALYAWRGLTSSGGRALSPAASARSRHCCRSGTEGNW